MKDNNREKDRGNKVDLKEKYYSFSTGSEARRYQGRKNKVFDVKKRYDEKDEDDFVFEDDDFEVKSGRASSLSNNKKDLYKNRRQELEKIDVDFDDDEVNEEKEHKSKPNASVLKSKEDDIEEYGYDEEDDVKNIDDSEEYEYEEDEEYEDDSEEYGYDEEDDDVKNIDDSEEYEYEEDEEYEDDSEEYEYEEDEEYEDDSEE